MASEKAVVWKQAEALFSESSLHVIAAAKVHKCLTNVAQLARQKKPPKGTGKPRLIVLTGEWDSEAARVQLAVHSCKPMGSAFKVNKSYSLSALVKLGVYQGEPGVLNNVYALELFFSGGSGDSRLAIQTHDEDILLQILAPLWHMIVRFPNAEQKRPSLVTYPDNTVSLVVQMEAWTANHLDAEIERTLMSSQCGGSEPAEEEAAEEERGKLSLVSAKEERDLQALLDRFALEVEDIEDFQQRLQDELAALEAANVHAILGSGLSVERVKGSLNDALALLEDVNENLATFDTKLMVMREDIAAIEARNNRLELQTRNNGKLLNALDGILERLQLPQHVELALRNMQFSLSNLDEMVKAGWELYDHLEALSEAEPGTNAATGISPALASMGAVADQRMRLAVLAKTYAERASAFIGGELLNMTNAAIQATAALRGRARCSVPDHSDFRDQTESLTSLLHVVRSLRPDILDTLGERYTKAVNTLLRKELRLYTSELRKLVAASAAALPSEPVLLQSRSARRDEARAMASFSTHHSALSNCLHLRDHPTEGSMSGSSSTPSSPSQSHGGRRDTLQPYQAFGQLLQHWIPLLFSELDGCADFLMLKEEGSLPPPSQASQGSKSPLKTNTARSSILGSGDSAAKAKAAHISPSGMGALEALVADVSNDFLTIVDLVSKQQQVQAAPMLATTFAWQARLADIALAAPLRTLLAQCCNRLLANFERFVHDTVAAVQRFEGKSSLSLADGVKGVHILPFVPNFAHMVARLEELQGAADTPPGSFLAQHTGADEAESDDEQDEVASEHSEETEMEGDIDFVREVSLAVGDLGGLRRGGPGTDSDALRRQLKQGLPPSLPRPAWMGLQRGKKLMETVDSLDEVQAASTPTKRPLTEAEIPDHMPDPRLVRSVRDVTDPAYALLIKAMFKSIERIAKTDSKHGDRLRLENYLMFDALVAKFAPRNALLAYFVTAAGANKEIAIQIYVQHQLEYAKLWKIVDFSQRVDRLLDEVGAEELPFQPGLQPGDLRNLLSTCMHHYEKRLTQLHARIHKHLRDNTDLIDLVWRELRAELESSYSKLVDQAAKLYPSVQLPTTPSDLSAVLVTIG